MNGVTSWESDPRYSADDLSEAARVANLLDLCDDTENQPPTPLKNAQILHPVVLTPMLTKSDSLKSTSTYSSRESLPASVKESPRRSAFYTLSGRRRNQVTMQDMDEKFRQFQKEIIGLEAVNAELREQLEAKYSEEDLAKLEPLAEIRKLTAWLAEEKRQHQNDCEEYQRIVADLMSKASSAGSYSEASTAIVPSSDLDRSSSSTPTRRQNSSSDSPKSHQSASKYPLLTPEKEREIQDQAFRKAVEALETQRKEIFEEARQHAEEEMRNKQEELESVFENERNRIRDEAYQQAFDRFAKDLESIKNQQPTPALKPEVAETATEMTFIEPQSPKDATDSFLNSTEYAGFPSAHKVPRGPPVTPKKHPLTPLAAKALANSAKKSLSVSKGEKDIFLMLVTRLKELVEFLNKGLDSSFMNLSNGSLNASNHNMSMLDTSMANVSLMAECGSGDASQMSFNDRLQEIIDISREISFHDVQVGTDEQWEFLQEENKKLTAQIEALQRALADTTKISEENGRLTAQLTTVEKNLVEQASNYQSQLQRLQEELCSSNETKEQYEAEIAEQNERIESLESLMAENMASLEFIQTHAARRPDKHIEVQTDLLADQLDQELLQSRAECGSLSEQLSRANADLSSLVASRDDLEHRFHELSGMMETLEQVMQQKDELEHDLQAANHKLMEAENICQMRLSEITNVRNQLVQSETRREGLEHALADARNAFDELHNEYQSESEKLRHYIEDVERKSDRLEQTACSIRMEKERLEIRCGDLMQELERQLAIKDSMVDCGVQTEVVWSEVKSEKQEMCATIERLISEVEVLENQLDSIRGTTEEQMGEKEEEHREALIRIERLSQEVSDLLDEKDVTDGRLADMQSIIDDLENKLRDLVASHEELESQLAHYKANEENVRADADRIRAEKRRINEWKQSAKLQAERATRVLHMAEENLPGVRRHAGGSSRSHPTSHE